MVSPPEPAAGTSTGGSWITSSCAPESTRTVASGSVSGPGPRRAASSATRKSTAREPTGSHARGVPRAAADVEQTARVNEAGYLHPCREGATQIGQSVAGACRNRTYRGPEGPQLVVKTSRTTRPDPPPALPRSLASRARYTHCGLP